MKADEAIEEALAELTEMIREKNARYGNSALEPLRICSRASVEEQLRVRIDDKIKRLQTLDPRDDDEDTIKDLAGYLVLLMAARRKRREGGSPHFTNLGDLAELERGIK